MAKHHALFLRLRERHADYLRFATDPAVPFDNNASERELGLAELDSHPRGLLTQ